VVPPALSAQPVRQVLIVEDDHKLAAVLARSLERAGYTCTIAESGDQALWAVDARPLDARPPDALVVDVMIPHPSGIEVCRHLRSSGFDGPIVVISARSNADDRAAAQRAGADRFLAKPFALAELVSTVDSLIDPGATS
jgi:DNA-binding response OmpR family regulator